MIALPFELAAWAMRHHVSQEALAELRMGLAVTVPAAPAPGPARSEARVQSEVRLEAAQKGVRLFRNNVGALKDERGVPVRYGLANDSKEVNKILKSSDLIGWRPVVIQPGHVGFTIARFTSRECKPSDWRWRGDEHETAQAAWVHLVQAEGGDAAFTTGPGSL